MVTGTTMMQNQKPPDFAGGLADKGSDLTHIKQTILY
jgi:hypothetical protein